MCYPAVVLLDREVAVRLRQIIFVVLALCIVSGCVRSVDTGNDNSAPKARLLLPDPAVTTRGSLDVSKGDTEDWKRIYPQWDGKVTLDFVIGDPFEGTNSISGWIRVLDQDAEELAKREIMRGTVRYKITFEAQARKQYYLQIAARAGKEGYKIRYRQARKKVDPCASCTSDQVCEEGVCVAKADPKWKGCGKCPRGHYCSRRHKKCVRNRCYKKVCPRGQYCSGGECRKKRVKPKKEPKAEVPKGPSPKLLASCLRLFPYAGGQKTVAVFNRGRAHSVSRGDRGSMGGKRFTIIQVGAGQSKAVINAPKSSVK